MTPSLAPSIAASLVTATLLYPLDYYKSILQLTYGSSPLKLPNQPKHFFAGLSAVNVSVFFKAFTRFGTFNYFNKKFNVSNNQNNPGLLISSLLAGVSESVVIIPFENVKINLIQSSLYNSLGHQSNPFGLPATGTGAKAAVAASNASKPAFKSTGPKHHNNTNAKDIFKTAPKLSSAVNPAIAAASPAKAPQLYSKHFFDAIANIYKTQGLYGFFKGTNMTLLRQCSNSIGFFSTYNSLKQLLDPNNHNSDSNVIKFGLNLATSLVIVAFNQPIDLIKSRFQADIYNGQKYKNSLDCAFKVYVQEGGIAKLYTGALPRLVKVSISGSIMMVFLGYFEKVFA